MKNIPLKSGTSMLPTASYQHTHCQERFTISGGPTGVIKLKGSMLFDGKRGIPVGFQGDLGPQLRLVVADGGILLEMIEVSAPSGATPRSCFNQSSRASNPVPPPCVRRCVFLSRARGTGEEPAQSTEAQRSWVYSHDTVVKYHDKGVPLARPPKGVSLDVGEGPRAST